MKHFFVILLALLAIPGHIHAEELAADESDSLWAIVLPEAASFDIDMGPVIVGKTKDSVVTGFVTNRGDYKLSIESIEFSGAQAAEFAVLAGLPPFEVAVGESVPVEFRFAPGALGIRTAQIHLISRFDTVRQGIRGEGVEPGLRIGTDFLDFGKVKVAESRDSILVLLENVGDASLSVSATDLLGPDMRQFILLEGGGTFSLRPGESRSLRIRFAPRAVGRTSGSIGFSYDGPGSPAIAYLFGEGVQGDPHIAMVATVAMGDVTCEVGKDTTVDVRNSGVAPLTILEVDFQGTHASDFQLAPLQLPVVIDTGQTEQLRLEFLPGANGLREAELVLTTDAANVTDGILRLPVSAVKQFYESRISSAELRFDDVAPNTPASGQIEISNTGSLPLSWQTPANAGVFVITNIVPNPLAPGAKAQVSIEFSGGPPGAEFSDQYLFGDPCGNGTALALRASVDGELPVVLRADDIHAATRRDVELTIFMDNMADAVLAGAETIETELRYNASLLSPIGATPFGRIENGERIIPLSLPISGQTGNVLATLRFKALLGNAERTPLTLQNSRSPGADLLITEQPGSFSLDDICYLGGTRLFEHGASLAVLGGRPNPSSDFTEIHFSLNARGRAVITLVSAAGANLQTLFDRTARPGSFAFTLDTRSLASGTYFLLLETPGETASMRLDVLR